MNTVPAEIVLVVASARNDVIGLHGDMPWHQPADLAHFKALTVGGCVVMGRKTFDSIGQKPLPKRTNLVLSRDQHWSAPGVQRVTSLDDAREIANGVLFVIGGSQVYTQALPLADRIEWTRIEAQPEGDTWFRPDIASFKRVRAEHQPADGRNRYAMCFETWVRDNTGMSAEQ